MPILSIKNTWVCTAMDGSLLVAQNVPNGWCWTKNGIVHGSIVPREHLDKMAFIVNGSIRRATLTTTINIEDNECQTSQDATEQ